MRSQTINEFKKIKLTEEEVKNIFLPNKRIYCQSCQKVRVKKLISKNNFNTNIKQKSDFVTSLTNKIISKIR